MYYNEKTYYTIILQLKKILLNYKIKLINLLNKNILQ